LFDEDNLWIIVGVSVSVVAVILVILIIIAIVKRESFCRRSKSKPTVNHDGENCTFYVLIKTVHCMVTALELMMIYT